MSNPATTQDLALLAAIHARSPAGVRAALRAGADPNTRDVDQIPAISLAVSVGGSEVTKELLASSPDLTATDKYGNSPLHRAVAVTSKQIAAFFPDATFNPAVPARQSAFNASRCVAMLAAAGACVDAANNSQATPLHLSVTGSVVVARALLAAGANVDIAMNNGATALHLAGSNGRADHVKVLLAANANPRLQDETGREPFVHAARTGRLPALRLLVSASRKAGLDDIQAMYQLRTITIPGSGPDSSALFGKVLSESTLPQDMADRLLLTTAINRQLTSRRSSKRFAWIPIAEAALSRFKETLRPQDEPLARCVMILFLEAFTTTGRSWPRLSANYTGIPVLAHNYQRFWPDLSDADLGLITRPASLLLKLDRTLTDRLDLGSPPAQRMLCAAARTLTASLRRSKAQLKSPAPGTTGRRPIVSRPPNPAADKLPPAVVDAIHLITAVDEIQAPGRFRPLRQVSLQALAMGQVPTHADTISTLRSVLANDRGQEMLAILDSALLRARPPVARNSAVPGRQRG